MIILEKESHPRPKLCGGGVTRLGLNTLLGLGFRLPLPIPAVAVNDIALSYQGKTIHVKGDPQIMIFYRPHLDHFLAQQALQQGIRLFENEKVNQIIIDQNEIHVFTAQACYHTQVLIGADGSNGLTRRFFRPSQSHPRIARTLEILQPSPDNDLMFIQQRAEFDFTSLSQHNQGYIWHFPTLVEEQPHINYGIYDSRTNPHTPLPHLAELLKQANNPHANPDSPQLHGYPIHCFSPFNKFAMERLLLVGDAAGADPLFGEGIAPALAYGAVAAKTIVSAFQTQDFSFRTYRQNLANSYLGRYLLIRWFTAQIVYRLGKFNWFSRTLWTIGKGLGAFFPPPPHLPK